MSVPPAVLSSQRLTGRRKRRSTTVLVTVVLIAIALSCVLIVVTAHIGGGEGEAVSQTATVTADASSRNPSARRSSGTPAAAASSSSSNSKKSAVKDVRGTAGMEYTAPRSTNLLKGLLTSAELRTDTAKIPVEMLATPTNSPPGIMSGRPDETAVTRSAELHSLPSAASPTAASPRKSNSSGGMGGVAAVNDGALPYLDTLESPLVWSYAWSIYNIGKSAAFRGGASLATTMTTDRDVSVNSSPFAGSQPKARGEAIDISKGSRSEVGGGASFSSNFLVANQHRSDGAFIFDILAQDSRYVQMTLAEARRRELLLQSHVSTSPSEGRAASEEDAVGRMVEGDTTSGSSPPPTAAAVDELARRRIKLEQFVARSQPPQHSELFHSDTPFHSTSVTTVKVRDSFPTHMAFMDQRWFWEELFEVRSYDFDDEEEIGGGGDDGDLQPSAGSTHDRMAMMRRRHDRHRLSESRFDGYIKIRTAEYAYKLRPLHSPHYLWYGWVVDDGDAPTSASAPAAGDSGVAEHNNATPTSAAPTGPSQASAGKKLTKAVQRLRQRQFNRQLMRRVLSIGCSTAYERRQLLLLGTKEEQLEEEVQREKNGYSTTSVSSPPPHAVSLHYFSPPCAPTVMINLATPDSTEAGARKAASNNASTSNDGDGQPSAPPPPSPSPSTIVRAAARLLQQAMRSDRCTKLSVMGQSSWDRNASSSTPSATPTIPQVLLDIAIPSVQIQFPPPPPAPPLPSPPSPSAEPAHSPAAPQTPPTAPPPPPPSPIGHAKALGEYCEAICRQMTDGDGDYDGNWDSGGSPVVGSERGGQPLLEWTCAGYRPSFLRPDDVINAFTFDPMNHTLLYGPSQRGVKVRPTNAPVHTLPPKTTTMNSPTGHGTESPLASKADRTMRGGAFHDTDANGEWDEELEGGGQRDDEAEEGEAARNDGGAADSTRANRSDVSSREENEGVSGNLTTPAFKKRRRSFAPVAGGVVAICEFFSTRSLQQVGWMGGTTTSGVTLVRTMPTPPASSAPLPMPTRRNETEAKSSDALPPPLADSLSVLPPLPFESSQSYALRARLMVHNPTPQSTTSTHNHARRQAENTSSASGTADGVQSQPQQPQESPSSFPPPPPPPPQLLNLHSKPQRTLFSLSHHHSLSRSIAFGVITNENFIESRVIPLLDTWAKRWDCYLLFEDYYGHRGTRVGGSTSGGKVKEGALSRNGSASGRGPPLGGNVSGHDDIHAYNYQYTNLDAEGKPMKIPENGVSQYTGDDAINYLSVPGMWVAGDGGSADRLPSPSDTPPSSRRFHHAKSILGTSSGSIPSNSAAGGQQQGQQQQTQTLRHRRLLPNYLAAERIDVAERLGHVASPLQHLMRHYVWATLNAIFGFGADSAWMMPTGATNSSSTLISLASNIGGGFKEKNPNVAHPFAGDDSITAPPALKQKAPRRKRGGPLAASADPRRAVLAALMAKLCRVQQWAKGASVNLCDDSGNTSAETALMNRSSPSDSGGGELQKGSKNGASSSSRDIHKKDMERTKFIANRLPDESSGRLVVPGTRIMMRNRGVTMAGGRGKGGGGPTPTTADYDDFTCGSAENEPCTMPLGFVRPLFVAEPRNVNNRMVHGRGGAWKNYPLLMLMLRADTADEKHREVELKALIEGRRKDEEREGGSGGGGEDDLDYQRLLTPREQLYFAKRQFYAIIDDDSYFVHRNLVIFLTYFVPQHTFGGLKGKLTKPLLRRRSEHVRSEGDGSPTPSSAILRLPQSLTGDRPLSFYTGDVHERVMFDPMNRYRIVHGGAGAFFNRRAALGVGRVIVESNVRNPYADDDEDSHDDEVNTDTRTVDTLGEEHTPSLTPPNDSSSDVYGRAFPSGEGPSSFAQFLQRELSEAMAAAHPLTGDGGAAAAVVNVNVNDTHAVVNTHPTPLVMNLSDGICAHPRHQMPTFFGDVWLGICATRLAHIEPISNTLFNYMTPFSGYWVGSKYKIEPQGSKFPLSFHNIRNEKMFYELYRREILFERQLVSLFEGRMFVCRERGGHNPRPHPRNASEEHDSHPQSVPPLLQPFLAGNMWHADRRDCYPKMELAFAPKKSKTNSEVDGVFYESHLPNRYVGHIPFPWARVASFPRTKSDISSFIFKKYQEKYNFVFDPDSSHEQRRAIFYRKMNSNTDFIAYVHKMLAQATV